MKLVGFSQGVSLETKEMVNYLDFIRENGTMFRLPVPDETIQALLPEVYGGRGLPVSEPAEPAPDLPPDLDGATSFGEGGDEPPDMEPPEPPADYPDPEPHDGVPESEEEVPSL